MAVAVQFCATALYELKAVSIEIATNGIKWRRNMETFIELPIIVTNIIKKVLMRS